MRQFKFMSKHLTYNYLKNEFSNNRRIVIARYGDGEYFILRGEKGRIAKQNVTKDLTSYLNRAIRTPNQLICLPSKIKITRKNLYEDKNEKLSNILSKYIIRITKYSLYGQGQWRMIDLLQNESDFLTNFFVGKTLIVTGHKETTNIAFENMKNIEVYGTPLDNASEEYKVIKKDLINLGKKFKNIIFGCGPVSNILISDLISECDANLLDIGSIIAIIINPFSQKKPAVSRWSGFGKKGDPKVIERCSVNFFRTLRKKFR